MGTRTPPSAFRPEQTGKNPELDALRSRISQLEEAVAARDDLIGVIGHELRNPLSPVFLQACHLLAAIRRNEHGSVTTEWLSPRLELFVHGLERLLERLNRLMDVAALQSGDGIDLIEEDMDLSAVVGDVVASMAREAAAASSPLTLSAPGPVVGHWDRVRVEQIARNLLSNAIRYGGGSAVDIQVKTTGLTAVLTVRDRGPGIPPELQTHIFDRFERANPHPQRTGLGLGLWIARRLCEVMRGTIAVESVPGRGAAFVVTLPRGQTRSDV